jgi:DnaJ family protein C protein 11
MRETEGTQDKIADVTIPVQALVNNSHLFIPGGRPKFNLLGFYVSEGMGPVTVDLVY